MVVSSVSGLFYVNYIMFFVPIGGYAHYLSSLSSEIFFLSLFVVIIGPASAVNEALLSTKKVLISLPRNFPQHFNELTMIIGSEFFNDVYLTLWKIYTIDRSLTISAMGTLLTYGIIIATLDTMKNPTNT
ncbi:hypothetical protein NPIL_428281 [Nephila pilipes]|uniref:Uncharacterized protein n=1 Tax=Nephila pilipes TaxID=299642 RepID=A0A8X6I7G4_NEPPI|nr:hypothetical protein NPIL_428281 [Nephila pilipes]